MKQREKELRAKAHELRQQASTLVAQACELEREIKSLETKRLLWEAAELSDPLDNQVQYVSKRASGKKPAKSQKADDAFNQAMQIIMAKKQGE